MSSTETYGRRVARLRKQRGWSQQDLSDESGVPLRTVQDIEGDKVTRPQRATREGLERALGVDADPQDTRDEWPPDVQVFLDVMGAYLATLTEGDRLAVMRRITRDAMRSR